LSGYFRLVDLDEGVVTLSTPMPESEHRADDPNPRGGFRGAKGVSSYGDRLLVANSERIFVLDRSWSVIDELSHPLMGAIHDVLAVEDGIWVTSTGCDLLLKVDWNGEPTAMWSWRSVPALTAALGFDRLPKFEPELDYRDPRVSHQGVHNIVHLNGLARSSEGLLLSFGRVLSPTVVAWRVRKAAVARALHRVGVSAGQRGRLASVLPSRVERSAHAIVALPDEGEPRVVLHQRGIAVPNHNVDELDGEIVYLDSNHGRLVVWRPELGVERLSVRIPGSPSFARGLARIDERRYVVGSQAPLALHVVDLDREAVVESIPLGSGENESVYGIGVVPPEFEQVGPAAWRFRPVDATDSAARGGVIAA